MGSVLLMGEGNLRVSLPLIGGIALLAGGFMLWTVSRFMGLRRQRPKTGQDEVVGSEARALEDFEGAGHVRLMGERWNARSRGPVSKGQRVRVVGIKGLTVEVEPMEEAS
jgi:membrane-bound serine protease (ClpP class)